MIRFGHGPGNEYCGCASDFVMAQFSLSLARLALAPGLFSSRGEVYIRLTFYASGLFSSQLQTSQIQQPKLAACQRDHQWEQ